MKKKRKNSRQFNDKFKKKFFTVKSAIIMVLTMMIVLFLGFGGIHQKRQADRYRDTIEELSSEVKQIKDTNKSLEKEKKNASSDEFKERMAREKLGLVGKDEYVVKESDDEKAVPGQRTSQDKENTEEKSEE